MADQKERIIIETVDNTTRGMRSAQNKLNAFDRTIQRVQTTMMGFVGLNIGANALLGLARLSDKAVELDAKLKIMTSGVRDFAFASKELAALSRETGSALGENITLFTRINPALRAMGEETSTAIDLTRILAQSLRLSGASQQESASTVRQFSQAMASGILRGEEFNALMENSPVLMKALSDALGVSIGELRAMSKEGVLTAKVVVDGLKTQTEAIAEMHAELPQTIGRAWQNVNSAALIYFATLKDGNGKVAKFINSIADNFDRLIATVGRLTGVISVIWGVKAIAHIKNKITSTLADAAANKANALTVLRQAKAKDALILKEQQLASVRAAVVVGQARRAASEAALAKSAAVNAVAAIRAEGVLLKSKLASAQVSEHIAASGLAAMRQSTQSATAIAASEARVTAAKKVTDVATKSLVASTTALSVARGKLAAATTVANAAAITSIKRTREATFATATAAKAQGAYAVTLGVTARALRFAGTMVGRFWVLLTGPIGISLYIIYEIANAFFDLGKVAKSVGKWVGDVWDKLNLSAKEYAVKQKAIAAQEKIDAQKRLDNAQAIKENYASLEDKLEKQKEAAKVVADAYKSLGVEASSAAKKVAEIDDSAEKAAMVIKKLQKTSLEAFEAIADDGQQSAENIRLAFDAALNNTKNRAGLQALTATITRLESSLQISGVAAAAMMSAVTAQMPEAISSAKDLAKAVKTLGVDVASFGKGYSDAGKTAIAAIETLSNASEASLAKLGKDAKQSSEIIGKAFENAIDSVETVKGVEAIWAALSKMVGKTGLAQERLTGLFVKLALEMENVDGRLVDIGDDLSDALDALGISIAAAITGISDTGREVIDSFDKIVESIAEAGLTGQQSADVIYESFKAALSKVSTVKGIKALQKRIRALGHEGVDAAERIAEAFERISGLGAPPPPTPGTPGTPGTPETNSPDIKGAGDIRDAIDLADKAPTTNQTVTMLNKVKVAASIAFEQGIISSNEYESALSEVERKLKKVANQSNNVRTVTFTFAKMFNTSGEAAKRAGEAFNKSFAEGKKQFDWVNGMEPRMYTRLWAEAWRTATLAGERAVVEYEKMQKAIADVNSTTERLVDGTSASISELEKYAATLRRAAKESNEYGQAAASALDRVTSKIDQMRSAAESATSEVASLQVELLSAQGNDAAAAELRHKQRILDMQVKLAEAQAEGNIAQASAYENALLVLGQIGDVQRKNREDDRKEREAAATPEAPDVVSQTKAPDVVSQTKQVEPVAAKPPTVRAPGGSSNVTSASDIVNAVAAGVGRLGALENFLTNIGATAETVSGISTNEAGETITVDLKVGDVTSRGTFIKNDDTISLLEELRLAGATT